MYQGHHGDFGATNADVILPSAAYTEQNGIYVNLEGRPQIAKKAVLPVGEGEAKEDIAINKELAGYLEIDVGVNNLQEVRRKLAEEYEVFANIGKNIANKFANFSSKDKLLKEPIIAKPINYYMTDVISKNSVIMAKCVEAKSKRSYMSPREHVTGSS